MDVIGTMQTTLEHEGATTVHQANVVASPAQEGSSLFGELQAVLTTVTVYPEEGLFPDIARGLLEAADHPYQVRSVSYPKAGFEVPADVFERFAAARSSGETIVEKPRKRRPGRPSKQASNPSKEE